jgi:hypothetical protein
MLAVLGRTLPAQMTVGARVTAVGAHADGTPGGGTVTELRAVEPIIFASAEAWGGRVRLHAMLNGEAWTIRRGQIAPGVWGEGYVDRRHPHTTAHELMVTVTDAVPLSASLSWSVSAGKGFAPFGTDDPMARPALRYPVNHHWSQVLERAVVSAAVRHGAVTVEAGIFNGDEPERPGQWPKWDRVGDSWSARVTVRPRAGLEFQASHASVLSPEFRAGVGPEHVKWSASARLVRPVAAGTLGTLVEWSSNSELNGFFEYRSVLAEAEWAAAGHRPYLRVERTERPEEERLSDNPYRSLRPHLENSNLGITRWTILTAGYGRQLGPAGWPVRTEALVEGSFARARSVAGGVFDPAVFYGGHTIWTLSVALRVAGGAALHRMGRYGVATDDDLPSSQGHHE